MIAADELYGTLISNRWYRFVDAAGVGFCQPDHELHLQNYIICIECKLTQTHNAHLQMQELYIPVLEEVYKKKVFAIQATHTLLYKPDGLVSDLSDFVFAPRDIGEVVWHVV